MEKLRNIIAIWLIFINSACSEIYETPSVSKIVTGLSTFYSGSSEQRATAYLLSIPEYSAPSSLWHSK